MPATGNFILDKGYDAEAAITKFRAVKAGATAEGVTPITVAGEDGIGVEQFGVATADLTRGKGASVRVDGITEWEAGAAIAREADVTVDSVGRCVTAVATNRIWGKARQATGAAGNRISVQLAVVKQIKA
jgi:hypothetical protein